VGLQAHWSLYEPTEKELRSTIEKLSSLGLKIQFTELDISVYPWEKNRRAKRPDDNDAFTPEREQQQLEQYKKVFSIFREYKNVITGVTCWGISDRHTWLDEYPVAGRKNYPMLFDQKGQRKRAFDAVVSF